MFLKLLLHAGKIFITRRIITRDVENDPRIYQQTSFSIPAKISLRSTKNDRTNETTRIPIPPTRTAFSTASSGSKPGRAELRSLAARVFQFAPNGSVARKIRDCRDLRVSGGRVASLVTRKKKLERGEGEILRLAGSRRKNQQKERWKKKWGERRRRSGIFQPEFLDVVIRSRERERGSRRKTFNSRDVYFRRT